MVAETLRAEAEEMAAAAAGDKGLSSNFHAS
jgi:hypothetical protein